MSLDSTKKYWRNYASSKYINPSQEKQLHYLHKPLLAALSQSWEMYTADILSER